MVFLGNRDHSVIFDIASKYCISDCLIDYDRYSIFSKWYFWVGRSNIVRMTVLPNAIYGFGVIPIKLPMVIFYKTRTKISQFMWKHKSPQIAKAVLRKKNGTFLTSDYSHEDSMVLAQKQKYRPMEQDRKPRDKPVHLWEPYFWQRRQEYTMGAKTASSINYAGKTGQLHVKWN